VSANLVDLQQRAIEFARSNDFGTGALEINLEITGADASNQGAWTRLARCYLEQRRFADAAGALATVLELNPSNTIAKSLQTEVTKRRAMALPMSEAASGFSRHDFDALDHLAPVDAARALGPKIEQLLMSLNEQRTPRKVVEARGRAGQAGTKLFHRNSYHPGTNGHIFAYHHGGRWEPQFNIGFFSRTPWGGDWMRVGLGFNLTEGGRDPQRDVGQEQIARYFDAFQRQIAATWRAHLIEWMGHSAGFIQHGDHPPAIDMRPQQAVEWLINCHNPVGQGWLFVGRWLSLDKPDDANTLSEMRKLVAAVEDTFAALFPLWTGVYGV
jgi:hypothetical protein